MLDAGGFHNIAVSPVCACHFRCGRQRDRKKGLAVGKVELPMASIGGAFGGNRGLTPVPPEKGVFPLDHLHECDDAMKTYMRCLKENNYDSEKCRQLSRFYLECRMERNLMARQDLKELGFKDDGSHGEPKPVSPASSRTSAADQSREKLREGFVSGIPRSAGSSR